MFSTLFPYGIGAPEMQQSIVKIFLDSHIQYFLNLEDETMNFQRTIYFNFYVQPHTTKTNMS
jgi:hypothetical protein